MLFPTGTFAIFFMIVLPLSWLLMPWVHRWRPFMILALRLVDWRFVFLLVGSIAWNQLMALRVHHAGGVAARRKTLLWLAIGGNLALLGYFKLRLLHRRRRTRRPWSGWTSRWRSGTVILPVGISFYTFMGISYVVDVYRGDTEPTTLEKFAVYLSFFPHLVVGPIVRPNELIPQFDTPRSPRRVDTSRAFYLIAAALQGGDLELPGLEHRRRGLQLASTLARDPDRGLRLRGADLRRLLPATRTSPSGSRSCWASTSRRTSTRPTRPRSLQDFWRRWHMTLLWLRDYLYIPLGGAGAGWRSRTATSC